MTSQWLPAIAAAGLPGTTHELPHHALSDEEWTTVLDGVHRERLTGLFLAAIDDDSWPVTQPQRDAAIELHVESMATVLLLERTMLSTFDVLESAGVEARVLKGSGVAFLDYADAALRPFIDVDLLIRPRQFDAAVAALVAAGYIRKFPEPRPAFDRRFSKGTSFDTPDGFELDLHRTFVMGPYGLTLDLDELWRNSQAFEIAGRSLLALGPEERLLHACYHAALGDTPPRLLPRRDIAEMVLFGQPDLGRLLQLSSGSQADSVLAHAVRSTWETLGIADAVALSEWARTYPTSEREQRNIDVYLRPQSNYAAKSLAAIRAIPSWRERAAFMTALTVPQTNYLGKRHRSLGTRLRYGVSEAFRGRPR